MKAVILAAGEGSRLQPVTLSRPKHLIKVGGRPILEYCLHAVKASGISEVIVVIHFKGDAVRQYFGNGERYALQIEYLEQKGIFGTGNAVSLAEQFVKDDFLLLYGDLLFSEETVKAVVKKHDEKRPAVTMAVVHVDNPWDYGIVELEDEEHVKRVIEKPKPEETSANLANAGIYAFSTEIFDKIRETSASSRGEWEITDAISLLTKAGKEVLAVKISSGDWVDVGRPWDLLEANRWALTRMDHKVCGFVEDGAHIVGAVTIAEDAYIRSGAYIEGPAFIDGESDIGPNCYIRPYTSIGKGVRIGNACEVKNSIVMDRAHIGHLSYVGDSVIGERCNLGAGTMTANYRLDAGTIKMVVKGKVVDSRRTKLGVVLGDDVKTGINALFMPGVSVGNDCWVGPGVVVYRDLPANSVVLLRQNVEERRR